MPGLLSGIGQGLLGFVNYKDKRDADELHAQLVRAQLAREQEATTHQRTQDRFTHASSILSNAPLEGGLHITPEEKQSIFDGTGLESYLMPATAVHDPGMHTRESDPSIVEADASPIDLDPQGGFDTLPFLPPAVKAQLAATDQRGQTAQMMAEFRAQQSAAQQQSADQRVDIYRMMAEIARMNAQTNQHNATTNEDAKLREDAQRHALGLYPRSPLEGVIDTPQLKDLQAKRQQAEDAYIAQHANGGLGKASGLFGPPR